MVRYGPSEIVSVVAVVSLATTVFCMTGSRAWSAFAGSVIEAPIYYGVMWLRAGRAGTPDRLKVLSTEFGPASIVTALLRPLLLYECPVLVGSIPWGTSIAKIAADCCFYTIVIYTYETMAKRERRRGTPRARSLRVRRFRPGWSSGG